ncbi:MAG: hypothetical protein WDO13_04085 [Verrucomicrobiota bacterium]
MPDALRQLKRMLGLREAVLVSTCNRVEYFGATTRPEYAAQAWPEFLRQFHAVTDDFHPAFLPAPRRALRGAPLRRRLRAQVDGRRRDRGFRPAQGRLRHRPDPRPDRQVGSIASSSPPSPRPSRSAPAPPSRAATSRSARSPSNWRKRSSATCRAATSWSSARGETGERTARSLQRHGVRSIFVANRTYDRAQALAQELGGEAVRWEDFEALAPDIDIMVSSTSAPHYVLTREKLAALRQKRGPPPALPHRPRRAARLRTLHQPSRRRLPLRHRRPAIHRPIPPPRTAFRSHAEP